MIKVTDYIISFLIEKGVTDIFGYPGGVICHLMDSAQKKKDKINNHGTYHEQGAAFAACGYAQSTGKLGVAYATSGPGATNLITGVANAYFDSIPVLFITGQVDTYAARGEMSIRQRGFQETDIVSMTSCITKYCVNVDSPEKIKYCMEKAYWSAVKGNPGPVVLDIPADVQRAKVDLETLEGYIPESDEDDEVECGLKTIESEIGKAERPCLLVGNGVKLAGQRENFRKMVEVLGIPVVFSMPAFDLLPYEHPLNFGFIGANGKRYANFVLGKSDLIISIGSRLDLKQVGNSREQFCPKAALIRIDIDADGFSYKVHADEISVKADLYKIIPALTKRAELWEGDYANWLQACRKIKEKLTGIDDQIYNRIIKKIGANIPEDSKITLDVGQSQLWAVQSLQLKEKQEVYMSGGHGAMGYSLPAAIGIYYGGKKQVFCFNGDGGIQMNLQELQFIKREKIPVKIIILNNYALGMIRGFQEANFEKRYIYTTKESGYAAPDFEKLAYAYDLPYSKVTSEEEAEQFRFQSDKAEIVEISLPMETVLVPNFGRNGLIQDQRPYIDRELFNELMEL